MIGELNIQKEAEVAGQMSFRIVGVKLLFQVALLEVRIHAAYIV